MKIRSFLFACALATGAPAVVFAGPDEPNPPAPTTTNTAPGSNGAAMPSNATSGTMPSSDKMKLSDVDKQVVAHLHAVDQTEIKLGKLAERNGTAQVKTYGRMLVTDHTAFDKKLVAFAKQHGVHTIPKDESMSSAQRDDQAAEYGKLKELKGAAFDQELLPMVATAHDQELTKADANLAMVNSPQLKTMLTDLKPVLQKHADEARRLESPAMRSSTPTTSQ